MDPDRYHVLLERIAVALERQVPTLVFMTDNGGLVPLPEHLREDAKAIPQTRLVGSIDALSKALEVGGRSDPGIRAIAAVLSTIEGQLVLMQRGPVEVPDLSTGIPVEETALEGDAGEQRIAPAVQRKSQETADAGFQMG